MGSAVQGALEQLASAPVDEVAITELDIAQAPVEDYTAVVQACLNVEKCVGITVWGVSDAVSLSLSARMIIVLTMYVGLLAPGRQPPVIRRQLQPQGGIRCHRSASRSVREYLCGIIVPHFLVENKCQAQCMGFMDGIFTT